MVPLIYLPNFRLSIILLHITVLFSIKFLHRYNLDGQYYQTDDYTSTETSKIGQLFQQHQEGKRRKTNYTDVITLKGIINQDRFTIINIDTTFIITISSCMTLN